MEFRIGHLEGGVLSLVYFGDVSVDERFHAHDALEEAMKAEGARSLLIDLSEANVRPCGAADGMALAQSIARRRHPFTKVAYLARAAQADTVATIVGSLYEPRFFRRFEDRDQALAWLRGLTGDSNGA